MMKLARKFHPKHVWRNLTVSALVGSMFLGLLPGIGSSVQAAGSAPYPTYDSLEKRQQANVGDSYTPHSGSSSKVDVRSLGKAMRGNAVFAKNDEQALKAGFDTTGTDTVDNYVTKTYGSSDARRLQMALAKGGTRLFYVRHTEIVPAGDTAKVAGVSRYVTDTNMSFIDPNLQNGGIPAPIVYMGADRNVNPTYRFDPTSARGQELDADYLDATGTATVFLTPVEQSDGSYKWYWCINPTSQIPEQYTKYYQEPLSLSPQAQFYNGSEVGYLLGTVLQNAGMNGIQTDSYDRPTFTEMYKNIRAEYNELMSGNLQNPDAKSAFDPNLTKGQVRDMLYKITTKDGQPQTIATGTDYQELIPTQTDIQAGKSLELPDLSSKSKYEMAHVGILGVEYALLKYIQGWPIGGMDLFQAGGVNNGAIGFKEDTDRTEGGRGIARLLVAYVEAARANGSLKNPNTQNEIKTKTTDVSRNNGKTNVTVKLSNTDNASSLTLNKPESVTVKSATKDGKDVLSSADVTDTKVTFKSGNYPDEVVLSVSTADENQIPSSVAFTKVGTNKVVGTAYMNSNEMYQDSATGHWVVREFVGAKMNSSDNANAIGSEYSQTVLELTPQQQTSYAGVTITPQEEMTLHTTVQVGDDKASDSSALALSEGTHDVIDNVDYTGLTAKSDYTLLGRLMEVTTDASGKTTATPVAEATQKVTPAKADGTAQVNFKGVKLEAGKKYVVYEYLYKGTDVTTPGLDKDVPTGALVSHASNDDKAQTIAVKAVDGSLAQLHTTIKADGKSATLGQDAAGQVDDSKSAALTMTAGDHNVTDTVSYTGLFPGHTYNFTGMLVKIDKDGNVTNVKQASQEQKITEANGTVDIDFGTVNLEEGYKYVAFERATSTDKFVQGGTDGTDVVAHDINHANKDDQAETIVVGEELPTGKDAKLQTTVSVDGTKSSASESASVAAGTKQVVDTVDYSGLIAGSEYTLYGQLMKVNSDGSTTQVAEASNKFTPESADGQTTVDFGQVKLEAGAKYVVFETATSTNKIVKGDDGQATQHVVKHQDANDKAQAFTTESEKPVEDTTSVKVTKKWADGAKGESAEVELYADGEATGKKVTLNEGNNWTSSFDNLAKKNKDGNTIKYTVKELTSNYDYKITGDAENGFTITNSPSTATVSVPVVKKWADGAKGEEAVIVLTENGKETDKTITLNEKNDWKGEFTNLKKYDSNGKEITYSVTEKTSSYKYVVTSDGNGGYVVTNWPKDTIIPSIKTTVTAGKTSGSDSQEAVISTSDDSVSTTVTDHVELTNLAKGSYKLLGRLVDVTDSNKVIAQASTDVSADADKSNSTQDIDFGKVDLIPGHTYVVFEYLYSGDTKLPSDKNGELPKNPSASHENPKDKAQTVVVKKSEKPAEDTTSVKVTKKWADGAKGESAEVELYANGEATGKKVTLNEGNNWTSSFDNLAKKNKDGNAIKYTVKELTSNYDYKITGDAENGFTITNSPSTATVSVPVVKKWADGAKGEEAVIVLTENGKETDKTITLNEKNDWKGEFTNLKKYDSNGKEITYSVTEKTSSYNYTVEKDGKGGFVVTNSPKNVTPEKETTSVKVTKKWADRAKGESAEVELYANGEATGKKVTLNESNNWTSSFDNLAKKDSNGNAIKYTVKELTSNFNYVVSGDAANGYTITNSPSTATVSVPVEKKWADGAKGEEAVIELRENGKETGKTITLNADNNWKGSFTGLKKFDASGNTNTYDVVEKTSNYNYVVASDGNGGYIVTNKPKDTVVPSIKTTVTAGKTSGSESQEAEISTSDDTVSTTVTDHVELTGLAKGSYKLLGRLVDVTDGNKVVAQASTDVSADADNSSSIKDINFGNVALTAGHKYVVFEFLYSGDTNLPSDKNSQLPSNPTASHANPSDKAQTVVVKKTVKPTENKPEIKTTVTAGKTSGSDSQEAEISTSDDTVSTTVTDHVELSNLAKGSYKLIGRLVDVTDGKGNFKVVAQASASVTADEDNYSGRQVIDFGNVTLTAGHKYVAFEYLYPEGTNVPNDKNGELPKNPTASHENPEDKAQTVVVNKTEKPVENKPEIKTTITAGSTSGSDSQEAVIKTKNGSKTVTTTVTDHVKLSNLAKGSYKLIGRLVDVTDGKGNFKVVAQADATVTADKDNYSEEINFGEVTLTAGHKYVAFEYLYPEGTNVPTDKNSELPSNPTASHTNPDDMAQTVVVKQGDNEKPNKPTTPDKKRKGGDNGNVTPDKNRKGGDSGNVTPSQSGKGSSTGNSLPQTGERAGIAIVGIILVALAVVLFFRKKKTN